MANIIVSDTPEALAERVAMDFLALIQNVLNEEGRPPGWPRRFRVALSGGMTPKLFYSRLAQPPYRDSIPWDKLHIFWSDERCVPKDHPESNYRLAQETLLSYVPVRSSQVYRIHGEDAPPHAAKDYEKALRTEFGSGSVWPDFDLMLLGMGQDGHMASLMPGSPALVEYAAFPMGRRQEERIGQSCPPRWVVNNVVRSLQTVRITMTLPVFNHAKAVWFLVTGSKKATAFAEAQKRPDAAWPASLVRPERGDLRWYIDKAVQP